MNHDFQLKVGRAHLSNQEKEVSMRGSVISATYLSYFLKTNTFNPYLLVTKTVCHYRIKEMTRKIILMYFQS